MQVCMNVCLYLGEADEQGAHRRHNNDADKNKGHVLGPGPHINVNSEIHCCNLKSPRNRVRLANTIKRNVDR